MTIGGKNQSREVEIDMLRDLEKIISMLELGFLHNSSIFTRSTVELQTLITSNLGSLMTCTVTAHFTENYDYES